MGKKTPTLLTEEDIYLFNEGNHFKLYEKMGVHPLEHGYYFALWAPNAKKVSVFGEFNGWDKESCPLRPRGSSGIWEGYLEGITEGTKYKYHLISRYNHYSVDKPDPYGFYFEKPPRTASVVSNLDYHWKDEQWIKGRKEINRLDGPISVYEMHIGSWARKEDGKRLTYRELAPRLAKYIKQTYFTHVEFMPIMEHPFYGSWGYQITGYFGPTSRYGSPQDFMYLIDYLHQQGIGVILDWVPSHFPKDEHGLGFFDGTHLYEHADTRKGLHPDWDSLIFNYGRKEIQSFLISNAFFWLDKYHIDGLRLDAVASMLYLDYSRKDGQWIPNKYGGNENIEAIDFLRKLNLQIYQHFPHVQTIAEESTSWPMVSRPTYVGGLGFGMKWDMGWMHDTLEYMKKDPIYRKHHHDLLTFRLIYAFQENFMLALSHDEVVHGKGSMMGKMPGDNWQKFANLRLLLAYMFTQPGKKMLFMGIELGQFSEWSHQRSLDWHLLDFEPHQKIKQLVSDLNQLYRNEPALHQLDFSGQGFSWVDCNDYKSSIISYLRKAKDSQQVLLIAANFTPVPRTGYRLGVPQKGFWQEIINTDSQTYGGSNTGNLGGQYSQGIACHGQPYSLSLTLPPLALVVLKYVP
ncbi:MAG: 1,4-alpha-glucan branching protein GlgB [Actinomycetia bacterium]|nr:1,4-alpha-glucan branching protein GlgB [Actinomycetes bacterium]